MSNKNMNVVIVAKDEIKALVSSLELLNKKSSSKDLINCIHFEIGLDGAGEKIKNKATITGEGRMLISCFYAKKPSDFSKGTLYGDFYVPVDSFLETVKKLLMFEEDLVFSVSGNKLLLSVSDDKARVSIALVDENMVTAQMPAIEEVASDAILTFQLKSEDFQKLTKGAAFLSAEHHGVSDKVEFAFNLEKGTLTAQTIGKASMAFASSTIPIAFNPALEGRLKAFWRTQNGLPAETPDDASDEEKEAAAAKENACCPYTIFPIGMENFLIMSKFLGNSKNTCGISITPKYMTIISNGQIFMCTLNAIAHSLISMIEKKILTRKRKSAIVVDADELNQALSLITLAKTTGKNPQSIAKIQVLQDKVRITFKSVKCDIKLINLQSEDTAEHFAYISEDILSKYLSNLSKGNIYMEFTEDTVVQKTGAISKGPVILCNGDIEHQSREIFGIIMPLQDSIAQKLEKQTEDEDTESKTKGKSSTEENDSSDTVEETNNN